MIVFINLKNIKSIDLFKLYLLGAIIVSLKAFYILYAAFFIPLLFLMKSKNKSYTKSFIFLIFNKYFSLFILLLFFVFFAKYSVIPKALPFKKDFFEIGPLINLDNLFRLIIFNANSKEFFM